MSHLLLSDSKSTNTIKMKQILRYYQFTDIKSLKPGRKELSLRIYWPLKVNCLYHTDKDNNHVCEMPLHN